MELSTQEIDMSVANGAVRTTVPDWIYDDLINQVMALPEKKRTKWHATLTDKRGTRTKCIYKEGQLFNWSTLRRVHTWVLVMPRRAASSHIPLTFVGEAMLAGDDALDRALNTAREVTHTGKHHRNKPLRIPKQRDGCQRM